MKTTCTVFNISIAANARHTKSNTRLVHNKLFFYTSSKQREIFYPVVSPINEWMKRSDGQLSNNQFGMW